MSKTEELAEAIVFAHESELRTTETQSLEACELERVAAIASAALNAPCDPPASLSSKLAADALGFCAADQTTSVGDLPGFTTPRPRSNGVLLAFVLGAAASLALTLVLGGDPAPSMSELRAATIATDAGSQRAWTRGPSELSGAVKGDVVWRQEQQDGWLTFRDLPVLPEDQAYQLWIIDAERDGAPVDGGVFTIASPDQETLVPILARLRVGSPKAFVVTVEERRGVVVSKQEHVVAIASL